jgi:hypothetical protein
MDIVLRIHALKRMAKRAISEEDIRAVVKSGETIEEYPNDTPYPSRLLLGWSGGRPLHVVVAENVEQQQTIVITVYEPDTERWTSDYARRRRT